ncbi:MAG: type II secretion system F family protein [Verrucomicrobiota bacterium]
MPSFEYKAKTQAGQLVTGTLAAADRRMALAELGRRGYFPLNVDAALTEAEKKTRHVTKRVSNRDVLLFTQQLSSLLRSGMSLSEAISVLERRTQKAGFTTILSALHNEIVQGETLSSALNKHPKIFSKFYVNLVRAGEASGTLDEVLVRLVKYSEQAGEMREKVVGALIYPLIVVTAGLGAIIFFMTFMVPRFVTMFREMHTTMPLPTRVLIALSSAFTSYWWIGVAAIVVAVIFYRQKARTPEGRLMIDGLKLRLPIFGGIITAAAFGQFARTLATLLQNGVPVLNALQIVEDTMTNRIIANELREARTRVTDGTSISQPLAKGKVFPPLLLDMLAVGEESGEVVPALTNIADMYEQELAHKIKIFTTLLEPAIILVMAGVVGSIVLSILMAVFDITSGIGK